MCIYNILIIINKIPPTSIHTYINFETGDVVFFLFYLFWLKNLLYFPWYFVFNYVITYNYNNPTPILIWTENEKVYFSICHCCHEIHSSYRGKVNTLRNTLFKNIKILPSQVLYFPETLLKDCKMYVCEWFQTVQYV